MTTIPYPTPNRLKLADAIAAGKVRHYPFHPPESYNDVTGNLVTANVRMLLAAGLVEVPEPDEHNYSIVRLTPEGMAWVTRARTSKISTEGPGSTSPEPGPRVNLALGPDVPEPCYCVPPAHVPGISRCIESTKDGTE